MNISVFGLGYVGAVTAGCLAGRGQLVVGVDVSEQKVELFNRGVPPIVEPGLAELLGDARHKGLLKATTACSDAVAETDVSIVCVGTPSTVSGTLDLSFVRQVMGEIAAAVANKNKKHVLILRSTMLPGSTWSLSQELLSDLMERGLLDVYYFPEFLRESTAVADFEEPSLAVVGTENGREPEPMLKAGLFGEDVRVVDWQTAEMVKYACNAFHATKITFANEIGRLGKTMSIDARAVMELVCQDTRLNISPYYLRPGNPFGGSCLPKDVRALTGFARVTGVSVPMLENLIPSNQRHLERLLDLVVEIGTREVVLLGLSFKANTDDLRESSMVEVAQTLLGRGYSLRIYDPALNLSALVGSNKRMIDTKMPHLANLLQPDLASAVGSRGLIIVSQKCASLEDLQRLVTAEHQVLDVNGWSELRELPASYTGFCW